MIISDQTLALLKNFSGINQNLVINPGSLITTISPRKDVVAVASVKEVFDVQVALYDLSEFLKCRDLVGTDEVDFQDDLAVFKSESALVRYIYADLSILKYPQNSNINMPECEVNFDFSQDSLHNLLKAAGLLGHKHVIFRPGTENPENVVAHIEHYDDLNSSREGNTYSLIVGDGGGDTANYEFIFDKNVLNFFPGDYSVSISSKKLAMFKHKEIDLTYYVTMNAKSFYGHG